MSEQKTLATWNKAVSSQITKLKERELVNPYLDLPDVAFCGRKGAGKTTAARFLIDKLGYNDVDDSDSPIVIDNLEYPADYWRLKGEGYVICRIAADEELRIDRLMRAHRVDDLDQLKNLSETELDGLHTNYVFINQGEEEHLHTQIIDMLYKEANRS